MVLVALVVFVIRVLGLALPTTRGKGLARAPTCQYNPLRGEGMNEQRLRKVMRLHLAEGVRGSIN